MGAVTRPVPRFLPTLTEVVHPSTPIEPEVEQPPTPAFDPQAIIERVRCDVDLVLHTHLEATVAHAVMGQVATIVARIRDEIEPMVRQAVADAVAAELHSTAPD
jgi:hypothetical protein